MRFFYKHSFHIYIQQKIKHRRHYHSFLFLHSNKIYLHLYTHISHYNWNKVLWTMSSPSSRLLTLVSLDNSFFSLLACLHIFACLLAKGFEHVMFQNVISQNMFYNWTMFMYTHKSRNTERCHFYVPRDFYFIYTNRSVFFFFSFFFSLWRWQTFLKTLWHV